MAVGSRMTRPAESQDASPEPTAMPMEKIASAAVVEPSLPWKSALTRIGSSVSATAPVSQNQLTKSPQDHRRRSACRCFTSWPVERKMFGSTARSWSPSLVAGISRLAPQHSTAKADTTRP